MGAEQPSTVYLGDLADTLNTIATTIGKVAPGAASIITAIKGGSSQPVPIVQYQQAVSAIPTKTAFGIPVGYVALIGGAVVITGTIFLLKKKPKRRR
jgi:hypothetical protein